MPRSTTPCLLQSLCYVCVTTYKSWVLWLGVFMGNSTWAPENRDRTCQGRSQCARERLSPGRLWPSCSFLFIVFRSKVMHRKNGMTSSPFFSPDCLNELQIAGSHWHHPSRGRALSHAFPQPRGRPTASSPAAGRGPGLCSRRALLPIRGL